MKQKLAKWLLFLAIINILTLIYIKRDIFLRRLHQQKLAEDYSTSQYVIGATRQPGVEIEGIGDDGLYAFAGYYYITGGDPAAVNFEHPPLGKYLIGLSIIIFGNENVVYIGYAILLLLVTYLLAKQSTQNKLVAAVSGYLLSVSPLFISQLVTTRIDQTGVSLLDLPQSVFFLSAVYFFIRSKSKAIYYWFSAFFLGCTFSSKFFPFLAIIIAIMLMYLWFSNRSQLRNFSISLLLIPIVYISSYVMYFFHEHSLMDYIRFQYWLIHWRLGNPVVIGNIWRTIFTGKYLPWYPYNGLVIENDWTLVLPVLVVLALISVSFLRHIKQPQNIWLIYIICVTYLIYLSVGTVGVIRYLFLIYPLLVILSVVSLWQLSAILLLRWKR